MSDEETRREDARIDARVERNLRIGVMGLCWYCKDPTIMKDVCDRWCCSYCRRMMDNPGD